MSYSRRQLYAMGEPLGDSATYRKADGGLVLGGGGPSTPASTTQTQTQELPEWARGYAKNLLAKGQALTDIGDNPYQTYGGDRTAGFSNLQKQSFAQAGPQGFQSTVGQYMSPYINEVINNQIASSNRGYDISAMNEAAKATQQGAFGGGRQAIMQAENERARNSANQNITAQGLQNAFQGATGQYNTGMQQLSSLGAQQQAQRQKELDVGYQEFLNQQNYPYQQLSYMQNLVRGTPMGMNQQSQVFQGPGNAIGQIAGLGMGAAGLASLTKADGGVIKGYADGGSVEDPRNIEAIVSKLSDTQLDQALKAAASRGDAAQIEAIQQELAMRASERNGIASAVTPDIADEMMPSAANGGIVAFSGKDDSFVSDPMGGVATLGTEGTIDNIGSGETILERMGIFNPENRRALEKGKQELADAKKPLGSNLSQEEIKNKILKTAESDAADKARVQAKIPSDVVNYDRATATRKEDYAKNVLSSGPKKGLGAALAQVGPSAPQKAATPEKTVFEDALEIRKALSEFSKEDLKALNDSIESRKGDADKIKQRGLSEALMHFGFNMAAQAAKPGSRQGLSGLLSSAGAAAPVLGQIASENQKLQQAASDNYMKLKMDQTRYQVALNKGDMTAATTLATQIRQGNMEQKKLDALIDYHNKQLALEGQKISQMGAAYAPTSIREAEWLAANKDNPEAIAAYKDATRQRDASANAAGARDRAALAKGLLDLEKEQKKELMIYPPNTPEGKKLALRHQNEKRLLHESLGFQYTGGGAGPQTNPNIKVLGQDK